MKTIHLESCFLLLVFMLLTAASPAQADTEPFCSLILEPNVTSVEPGGPFTVTIGIDPHSVEVYGLQYNVLFDPHAFEVVSFSPGLFLSQDGQSTYIIKKINPENGELLYAESRYGTKTGVSEPGTVSTIKFKAKDQFSSNGVKEFALNKVIIVDSNLQVTGFDPSNGTVFLVSFPVANFTSNVTEGEAPLTVGFTDASTNTVSWSWDFDGDGLADSNLQNPDYTYIEPGEYTVSLNVTNELGTIDTSSVSITVYGIPVAGFTSSTVEGDCPLTVLFTDTSTNAVSWSWDFDSDGGVDSEVCNPEYTYNESGKYTVFLSVANELGTVDMATEIIKVKCPPVAEPPVINSVDLFPANATQGAILDVSVDVLSKVGVTEVTADDIPLAKTDGVWKGSIAAPNDLGDHSLKIVAREAAGNTAVTSVPYHIVLAEGGADITVSPRFNKVVAGNSVSTGIKVKNNQNIDDVFRIRLNVDGVPASYLADLSGFEWTEKDVQLRTGEEKIFPLEVEVHAGTAPGYRLFKAKVDSETSAVYGFDTGYLVVS